MAPLFDFGAGVAVWNADWPAGVAAGTLPETEVDVAEPCAVGITAGEVAILVGIGDDVEDASGSKGK